MCVGSRRPVHSAHLVLHACTLVIPDPFYVLWTHLTQPQSSRCTHVAHNPNAHDASLCFTDQPHSHSVETTAHPDLTPTCNSQQHQPNRPPQPHYRINTYPKSDQKPPNNRSLTPPIPSPRVSDQINHINNLKMDSTNYNYLQDDANMGQEPLTPPAGPPIPDQGPPANPTPRRTFNYHE